ncbi:hypothetical protein E3U55_11210 [Filobacillus milosensis]|uniref:Competence protein n=1 Tax=Filobacillus milosensis TaxID=94137 RepID=A0A4Y8IFL5_9BACI|nr:competence protein ComK [Filobacillus milosensis]TFB19273.1 hypothetical protein E3U55_11210 [Filobacillus milosensis]
MVPVEKTDKYCIKNQTMLISPNYDPIYQSKIYEKDRIILAKQTPINIIDSSCIQLGGATMDGRKRAVEYVTKKKVMIPIPVEPSKGIILMPTRKIKDPGCEWIAYCHVKEYEAAYGNKKETKITFYNEDTYQVDIPYNKMRNQILIASHVFGYFIKDQYIS